MEKVDIAQQLLKGSHSTAASKIVMAQQRGKVAIAKHHGKGRHSAAVLKK